MSAPGWFPDPTGRFQYRYFDGSAWTQNVSTNGQQSIDVAELSTASPPALAPPQPAAAAPGSPPSPPPVYGVAPALTNGLAVSALVLGIIGVVFGLVPLFFFIALPLGLLALIFGIIGWRKTKQGAPRKGMSIAGTVLGVVALGLGVLGIVIVNQAVDDLEDSFDDIFGPADPDEYDVSLERCGTDQYGYGEAEGTITNTSNDRMSFYITVNFEDADGLRIAQGSDFITDLAPGATARWTAGGFDKVDGSATCDVVVE